VLTGAFGGGEEGPVAQPQHPHAPALARLLLERGADPNDGQTLYNRMFRPANDHLELLFEFGLGAGDGGVWKRRLGPALDSPADMVASHLWWAVTHDMLDRVRLLADHGVDVNARWRDGRSMVEWAAASGNTTSVECLREHGAAMADLAPADALIAAVMAGDRQRVEQLRAEHPGVVEEARARRPALVVSAAASGRIEVVRRVADLGFDVNALGRADAPAAEAWETALHQAAGEGDVALATLLLERGADPNIRDARFDATPLGWARHFDQAALVALLEPVTADS
jgi:ankyrin repeat protein